MIPAVSSDTDAYKTLTKNIGKRNIAVGEYRALYTTDSKKYEEIFTCNNQAVVMAGKENNIRVVCVSLDIHMTNLPMLIDFPLIINNMLTYSLPDVVEQRAFDVGQTVKFSAPVGATEVELRYHEENGDISVLDVMEANDTEFCKKLAKLCDVFVNDAFGTAHRAHASTAGVADYLPAVCGYLIQKEIEIMGTALANPKRPFDLT